MRRDIGMVLAGLGAFLIVLAIALPTYIAGHVIKFPLNYYYKATLVGPDTTYFSASEVKEVSGATVNAIYTLKGDAAAGNSKTAVWDLFTYVYDTGVPQGADHSNAIEIQTRAVAFDRKTAQLENCCGHNLQGKPVTESGIVGYVFPMNTQRKTYYVFDTTLLKAVPFTFAGTDTVDGVAVYKYNNYVPPTKIGFTALSATDPEYYSVNLTYWVDPETGALVKVLEQQDEYLINPITSARTYTLFHTTLAPTAASVQAIVNIDKSGKLKILLFETVMPIVLGVVGAGLLVWGVLLARRRPDLTESTGIGGSAGGLATAAPPDETAPRTAQTAPLPTAKPGEPASHRGGKHAAGSAVNIVPGMEPASAAAEAEPDKPDPVS